MCVCVDVSGGGVRGVVQRSRVAGRGGRAAAAGGLRPAPAPGAPRRAAPRPALALHRAPLPHATRLPGAQVTTHLIQQKR